MTITPLLRRLRIFSSADENLVIRCLAGVMHVLSAVCMALLTFRITERTSCALIAGAMLAVHPTGLYLAELGLSESSFVLIALCGVLLTLSSKRHSYLGAILLGSCALIRSNFILFGPLWALFSLKRKPFFSARNTAAALMLATFLIAPGLWILRNYKISGEFPLLSSIKGETIWGCYNEVSFQTLNHWGYWVFPDNIPGETPKKELAAGRSEVELQNYYAEKGSAYLKANIRYLPRTMLGRLIRAYVPIPWQPDLGAYAVALYRLCLFLLVCISIKIWVRALPSEYLRILSAMACTNLATTLIFYGSIRMTFPLEPFLLPSFSIGFLWLVERIASRFTRGFLAVAPSIFQCYARHTLNSKQVKGANR